MINKLLIFVNKFDENDDLLGFFVGWAKELTHHLENIIIVAQHIGKYEKNPGLTVVSIDKNQTPNPIRRALKFIGLLFQLKKDYDGVLVIMAPAWAVLAGLAAKVLRKKTYLWYAVWRGNWKLKLAEKLVDKIFCSVPETFPLKTKKLIPIGQGIDTDFFKPDEIKRKTNKILYLGRISPIKKLDILLEAISELKNYQPKLYGKVDVEIAGSFGNAGDESRTKSEMLFRQKPKVSYFIRDEEYVASLKKLAAELGISEKIKWSGRVPHSQTAAIFQEADVVVNMTPTGSFDKAMLEAMACGDLLLSSNRAWLKFFDDELQEQLLFRENDPHDLAKKLSQVLNMETAVKSELRQKLRDIIINCHSQKQWARKLVASF